jgi:hypothetical protein
LSHLFCFELSKITPPLDFKKERLKSVSHQGRFARPHPPPDHYYHRKRTVQLHAQPHLPRHVPGSDRLGHRVIVTMAQANSATLDNLWLLVMLVPFALVIRYGVVAREEAYLERKFGDVYRGYRSRVRRWL